VVRWLRERENKANIKEDKAKLGWLDQFFGDKVLNEINRDLIDEAAAARRKEVSLSTVNRYLALVRAILRMARDEWEWIDKIPHVRLSPEPTRRVRWLSPEDTARLLTELPAHLADMAEFTLATGLRQRNVSYLKWESVSLERGMAWIEASASKSRKAIVVPLNKDALRVLKRRLGMHPKFVFTFRDKPVAQASTKAWYLALNRAGIEDLPVARFASYLGLLARPERHQHSRAERAGWMVFNRDGFALCTPRWRAPKSGRKSH